MACEPIIVAMTQLAPTDCTSVPRFDIIVAIQSDRNAFCFNGDRNRGTGTIVSVMLLATLVAFAISRSLVLRQTENARPIARIDRQHSAFMHRLATPIAVIGRHAS
ncbi:hypothetical protein GCM10010987_44700 [Bradyrhizobium guangdongense]|uniref:Uncharacterized protein n=1 Tax=Bradyrhizobium guangdongense TaxID=1325090 RepID=A0AA88BAC4_9BRAD|nr:hypothetical protein GCM10010987_44700 [Bradyrhizobium guangdongense]